MSAFGGGPKDELFDWIKMVQRDHDLSDRQIVALVIAVLAYMVSE